MLGRLSLLALLSAGLTACSLYVGDGDDEGGGAVADASVAVTDAGQGGECEESEEGALDGLSSCMTMEGWESAGLCDLGSMNTAEGPCYSCHAEGMDGIQLESDCAATFEAMKTWPAQNDLVAARTDDRGCFTGFDVGLICGGEGLPEEHPPFVCPNSLAEALQDYLHSSLDGWRTGACEASD